MNVAARDVFSNTPPDFLVEPRITLNSPMRLINSCSSKYSVDIDAWSGVQKMRTDVAWLLCLGVILYSTLFQMADIARRRGPVLSDCCLGVLRERLFISSERHRHHMIPRGIVLIGEIYARMYRRHFLSHTSFRAG